MKASNRYQSNAKGLLLAFAVGFLLGRKLKGYTRRTKAGAGVVLYEENDWDLPAGIEFRVADNSLTHIRPAAKQ